ncbi:GcrA family cell cycle regulator [Mesorhizobium atlanticum]
MSLSRPEKQEVKPAPIALPAPPAPPSVPAVMPTFTTRESYFLPLPDSVPVDLADMEGGECHWPVNGLYGKEPIYCGRPADGAYCREHHRIAYNPAPSPKEYRHGASS